MKSTFDSSTNYVLSDRKKVQNERADGQLRTILLEFNKNLTQAKRIDLKS